MRSWRHGRGGRPRFQSLFRLPFQDSAGVDADVDAELDAYLEARVAHLVKRGMSEDEARGQALRYLGGSIPNVRVMLRRSARSRERRIQWRDLTRDILHDIRFVARSLKRRPAFTVAAVLCVAIGIGANAAMFAVVNSLLLRPPRGVRDPSGLLWINAQRHDPLGFTGLSGLTYPDYLEFSRSPTLTAVAAYATKEDVLVRDGNAAKISTLAITPTFMSVLGARPAFGRFFTAADDQVGAAPTALLSYDLWQSQFGGSSSVLGKAVQIGAKSYTIIGVVARGFNGVERSRVDAFVPTLASASDPSIKTTRRSNWLTVLARSRNDAPPERIARELDRLYHGSDAGLRSRAANTIVVARPMSMVAMRSAIAVQHATVALWLAAVAAVMLVISCANVASLLLTRAARRHREISIRLALGISRARLIRLLMAESTAIAALGTIAGLVIARWGGSLLHASLVDGDAPATSIFDWRVLLATLASAALTAVACGLAPALHASRQNLNDAMKVGEQSADVRVERALSGLMVAQVALALVLLVGAGLFVRSLHNLDILELGFDVQRSLRARLLKPTGATPLEADQLAHAVRDGLAALPGVEAVALATAGPFGNGMMQRVFVPDRGAEDNEIPPGMSAVSPAFFRTLDVPLKRGREFTDADRAGAPPVAIVNEAMAQHLWPNRTPLGRCIKIGSPTAPCATVVGVVGNTRQGNIVRQSIQYERVHDGFYVPLEQQPPPTRVGAFGIMLYVRTAGDATALVPTVRRFIAERAHASGIPDVTAFATAVEPQVRPWRIGVLLFGAFGVIALALAVVGLYGALAFRVTQRTREIGVRLALGASAIDVYRVVVGQGMRLVAGGVLIGLAGALTIGHALGTMLFGVSPRDPVVMSAIALVIVVASVVASWLPARRAARIDPLTSLRDL